MTIVYSRKLLLYYAIGGLALIPFLPTFIQKLQQKGQVDALRLVIWQDMLRVWHKRPVLGVGPGNVWVYDQISTHLPSGLRNINKSGLGVAHEGYLQTLTELGPLGLLCQISFLAIMLLAAWRLYRYAKAEGKLSGLWRGCGRSDLQLLLFATAPGIALCESADGDDALGRLWLRALSRQDQEAGAQRDKNRRLAGECFRQAFARLNRAKAVSG